MRACRVFCLKNRLLIGFIVIPLQRAWEVAARNRLIAICCRREGFHEIDPLSGLGVRRGLRHIRSPSRRTLRLEEAVSRALAAHPSITAETAQLQAVRARTQREALPPPYTIGGEMENVAGNGNLRGIRSAETTLRIGRVIELGGKREARQTLGQAELREQEHQATKARIDLASTTAARFIEVLARQQRLAYAEERVEQAERTRQEVAAWVKAARNPDSDLQAANIAVAEAQLNRESAEHELASAKMTLAASWAR